MKKIAMFVLGMGAGLACAAAPTRDAARGQKLFMKAMCYTCHGTGGEGGRYGPKLAPHPSPWEGFERQVRHPRRSMPRYTSQSVSDQDLADIYAYIRAIPAGRAAKDIPLLNQ